MKKVESRIKPRDEWKQMGDYEVYCEDGKAIRAVKGNRSYSRIPATIYRASPKGGWVNVSGRYTPETVVRKGLKTGKYKIM